MTEKNKYLSQINFNYIVCRSMVAFVWFYHGLVPKLLGPDAQELAMNMALGFNEHQAKQVAYTAGIVEMVFAVLIIVFWKRRWPLVLSIVLMVSLFAYCVLFLPAILAAAFNPLTTNLCVIVLSLLAIRLHGKQR